MEGALEEVRRELGRAVAVLATLALVAGAARPAFAVDPRLSWRTMETEHFVIHFPSGGYRVALTSGRDLEAAYAKLTAILGHRPWRKTEVVLTDDVDSANGSATTIPIPLVHGYMNPPGSGSLLGDYDEWLWLLLVHEMTHIVHLGTTSGLPALGNAVFGHLFGPNYLQPDWIIEGLAVFMESTLSSGGRNRSSLADMYLRAQVLDHGRLWPVDKAGGQPVDWPGGNVWYLYGGRLWKWMTEHRGLVATRAISKDYGSRTLPFAVNDSSEAAVKLPWEKAYARWAKEETLRDQAVIASVRAAGERRGRALTRIGRYTGVPRWLPSGGLLFFADGGRAFPAIRRVDLSRRTPADVDQTSVVQRVAGAGLFDVGPRGRVLVWSAADFYDQDQVYDDLWASSASGGPAVRLTRGMRARDPALSGDGTRLAFVANRRGETAVYVMSTMLREGGPGHPPSVRIGRPVRVFHRRDVQVDRPSLSLHGRYLAFSAHRVGGDRDIALVDLSGVEVPPPRLDLGGDATPDGARTLPPPARPDTGGPGKTGVRGALRFVTNDRAEDVDPAFGPRDRFLYFSSDRTGIYDVYAQPIADGRPAGPLYQVTNTPTGAFEPRPSPDGRRLAYVDYGSRGYDVAVLSPLAPANWTLAPPYHDDRPPSPAPKSAEVFPVRPYSPFSTLRPFYWTPLLTADPSGLALGVTTSGGDVVGLNAWNLAAWYGLSSNRLGYQASYSYYGFYPTLNVSSSRYYRAGATAIRNGKDVPYTELAWSGSVGVGFSLPHLDRGEGFSISYRVTRLSPATNLAPLSPGEQKPLLPEAGLVTRLDLGWSASTVHRFAESISPEEGMSLNLGASLAGTWLGGDFGYTELYLSSQGYLKVPGLQGNVLALNLSLGAGIGDFGRRRFFSIGGLSVIDPFLAVYQGQSFYGPTIRGFEPYAFGGDGYAVANLEYRFPILDPQRGIGTLPVFIRRISGAVFADMGGAGNAPFLLQPSLVHVGVGAELRASIYLSYVVGFTLRLGWAHGFGEGGQSAPYLGFGGIF